MKKILLITQSIAVALLFATTAHAQWFKSSSSTSDAKTAKTVEQTQLQIDQMVGYPSILHGFEKRMVRMLYEKRDDPNYRTFTYLFSMTGQYIFLCDSVGFGINASIQFSSPQKLVDNVDLGGAWGEIPMPQAEPNALFMPEGLAATYVLCVDEKGEDLLPIYAEPEIIVSPFPLTNQ